MIRPGRLIVGALAALSLLGPLAMGGHHERQVRAVTAPAGDLRVADLAANRAEIAPRIGLRVALRRASRSRPPAARAIAVVNSASAAVVQRAARPGVTRSATVASPAPAPAGEWAWAHSRDAYRVSNCESGDRHAADVDTRYNGNAHESGYYSGKWQMDASFWSTYGGLAYAGSAANATEAEQDVVAFRGWRARGWEPWECAGIMGVG